MEKQLRSAYSMLLQAELAAVKAEITRLKQNASLLERLAHASNVAAPKEPASTLISSPPASLPLTSPSLTSETSSQPKPPQKRPPSSDLGSLPLQKAAKLKASTFLPSQMTTAHTFSVSSANHGYRFLYLPLRRHLPIGQLRSRLRQLNISTRRILNIHYPDRHPVGLLIHNDYEDEFRSQLKKFKIPIQDDYDPLDPSNLHDLDYDD
ncbi:hypothetical protein CU097_015725 [Rhizopus azygosporus]|uniref:Uncharacterized protein n=1 Tax=Rhizopus azygosporus TaxID=86630 RepID=A0A367KDH0_RHIAZ|nr:hypothetical protein CU097_015725 [Rhizopus azygosporus]